MIIYMKRYTRADLRANPDVWFVFGDNVAGVGYGGQAGEARGEPNAFGIPTKWSPTRFFSDSDFEYIRLGLGAKFAILNARLAKNHPIVWPLDGVGTGLADMANQCPMLWKALNDFCADLGIVNQQAFQIED